MKRMVIAAAFYFILTLFNAAGAEKGKNLKVVSLAPSVTEIIFQLKQGDKLVGRTSVDNYPEEVKKVPVIGGFGTPSLEKLLTVRPDVVFASALKDPAIEEAMKGAGIKFVMLPTESIEQYFEAVRKVGKVLGCPEEAAGEIKRIKEALTEYGKKAEKVPEEKRPVVFVEIWDNPLMTAGKDSFLNDFINYAGGRNMAGDIEKGYFNCSEEWVISSRPDVLMCPAMKKGGASRIAARKGWEDIPAVKNGRVYTVLNDDVLFRLGPRMLEGIENIRMCLYPEKGKSTAQ